MAIMTPSQARESGRKLGLSMLAADEQNSKKFKEMLQELNEAPLNTENMAEIGALLSLPDDQFALIAPAFIEELEKSYNTANTQLLMV